MRIIPRATDPRADRLYVASGDKLLGIDPVAGGSRGWFGADQKGAFTTFAPITAGPVSANFGSKTNPNYIDLVVYVGTSDGTLYALNDSCSPNDPLKRRGGASPLPERRRLAAPVHGERAAGGEGISGEPALDPRTRRLAPLHPGGREFRRAGLRALRRRMALRPQGRPGRAVRTVGDLSRLA